MRVTNARGGESFHNFGAAYDVTLYRGGSRIQRGDDPAYTTSGVIGRTFGLEWGGDWRTFRDMPHFQLTGGQTEAQMRARFEAGLDIYTGR
jgi:peptidoglycan L-alanyl-D-glutamate endopeptidase CwlK